MPSTKYLPPLPHPEFLDLPTVLMRSYLNLQTACNRTGFFNVPVKGQLISERYFDFFNSPKK